MVLKLGLVVENDGEVAVLIPLRIRGGEGLINFKSYEHACVQLRENITRDDFLSLYGLGDVAEQEKTRMVKSLGITEDELGKAMEKARTDGVECQNLLKLVIACRKESTKQK
jgi:hypothetical protein